VAPGANAAIVEPTATPMIAGYHPGANDVHQHGAACTMRQKGINIGRHDDRDRGSDAKLHAHIVGHAEDAEYLVEDRHDDAAAADTEHAGENPGDKTATNDHSGEPDELTDGKSTQHPRLRRSPGRTAGSI
jgi:hypothetical protein